MQRRIPLTFACGDYEIMRALKEGIVQPEGIELTVLTDMAALPRHWRFCAAASSTSPKSRARATSRRATASCRSAPSRCSRIAASARASWLVSYSHEHGVIQRRIPLDELFLNVSEGRNRNEYRI